MQLIFKLFYFFSKIYYNLNWWNFFCLQFFWNITNEFDNMLNQIRAIKFVKSEVNVMRKKKKQTTQSARSRKTRRPSEV